MSDSSIRRVKLPSGGWWEIDTNPKWGKMKGLKTTSDPNALLVALTAGWSLPIPPSLEAIDAECSVADVIAVMEVVNRDVLPLFERLRKRTASTARSGKAK